MTTSNTTTAICPKCNGQKSFQVWSHIVNGRCFTCGGSGVVNATTSAYTAPSAPKQAVRVVGVPGFGVAHITRDGVGFAADLGCSTEERPFGGRVVQRDRRSSGDRCRL